MATFIVTTPADELDAADTNTGTFNPADLSLREALALSAGAAGADTIIFASSLTGGTLTLSTGQLGIATDVTINGDIDGDGKADITVDANGTSRVFNVTSGTVGLNGLVITKGSADYGGGLRVTGGNVTLTNSELTSNYAAIFGGAIDSTATLTIANTTISGNTANNQIGAIRNNGGDLALINTTLADNIKGGLGNIGGTSTLTNVTISGHAGADGLAINGGNVTLTNSLVAGNSSDARTIAGTLTLNDANIVGDARSFDGVTQQTGIALTDIFASTNATTGGGQLADNGGSVHTIAIKTGGAAHDNGSNAALPPDTLDLDRDGVTAEPLASDARGSARVAGTNVDIGAFEQQLTQTLVVTTLDDELDSLDPNATLADFGGVNDLSLREAIVLANRDPASADTITFANGLSGGTLRLTSELVVGGALTIDGDLNNDGTPDITITGDAANNDSTVGASDITDIGASVTAGTLADNVRIFNTTASLTIEGLTLTGGSGTNASGGAILATNSASVVVTLRDSVLSGNRAVGLGEKGGAVSAHTLDATKTVFEGNRAEGSGGAVSITNGSFDQVRVQGNSAHAGGGIYATGNVEVVSASILGNVSNASGGGITANTITLTGSTVAGNNSSGGVGGGVVATDITATNTTVAGNSATSGGGLYGSGSVDLTNVTVTGNGFVGVRAGDLAVTNSIIAGNAGGAYFQASATTFTSVGANIIGTNVFVGAVDVGDVALTDIFAAIDSGTGGGRLANNGGLVQTVALKQSLSNPAIDASNGAAPATDARGMARVDYPGIAQPNGSTADLGAFELTGVRGTNGDDSYIAPASAIEIDALYGNDTIVFNFKLTEAVISYVDHKVIIDGPGSSYALLSGFEKFVFTDGTVNNADGKELVDDLFYFSRNHDVWNAGMDADAHYELYGWREVRDPSAFFSTAIYLSQNPELKGGNVSPVTHFHEIGWKSGTVPSLTFDPGAYLDANPDVKAAGLDPLAHYLYWGRQEGRQAIAPTEIIAANGFDYVWYLEQYPGLIGARVDPLLHFQTWGWKEGRTPNEFFDAAGYLATYTDVAAAGMNPLDHYNLYGWKEGRDPSPGFDTTDYLAANPDVAAAKVNPMIHYLMFGQHEGRTAFSDGVWG